ncbi:porin family protein [Helicobacter cetorum]|uniref:Outer membrane protein n=1 Tax=Helicobacter cetorum (strain ATCC BAA-540 / CCUG 52418 / MIT 99-5656) TaxID=1163745 RepID=I0EUF0_HELCM|nr:hypothetical protein [Helicobacter cetorum]AFI06569.1 hypothetical protein HCD_07910 [Helicobacter cetorum MIT 99-5656]
MKAISKKAVFVLASFLSECEAHSKSGFFVEGGFETGLMESKQEIIAIAPKNLAALSLPNALYSQMLSKKAYFSNSTLKNDTTPIFTEQSLKTLESEFSTTNGLKVSLDSKNDTLNIKNFMPYNLHNLDLVWTKDNGQKVVIGGLETLDAQSQVRLSAKSLEMLKGVNDPKLSLESSKFSDSNTQRVLQSLSEIDVNITGRFDIASEYLKKTLNPKEMSVQQAKDYVNAIYDLAYVLSSKDWADLVLNYPGDFTDSDPSHSVREANKIPIISKEFLIKEYREPTTIFLYILSQMNGAFAGLTMNCQIMGENTPKECHSVGLLDKVIDPNKDPFFKDLNINNQDSRTNFQTLVHEFGHVKGYSHMGNMTCPDGSWKGIFCYQSTLQPSPSDNRQWFDYKGKRIYRGMVGVTQQAWADLGKQNKLPVNYNDIGKNFAPSESINQAFMNSFNNAISHVISSGSTNFNDPSHASKSNRINHANNLTSSANSNSSVSKNYRSAMMGFNVKVGYQQYFNQFLGLSYYGIVKYNFSKINDTIRKVSQVSLGVGADLLIDFFNTYSKNTFTSSLGVFMGLRALYNGYSVLNFFKSSGNLDFVGGFSYRYKHSKYSVGVSLPLIQHNMKFAFENANSQNFIVLKEGSSHFGMFFNYGWVF